MQDYRAMYFDFGIKGVFGKIVIGVDLFGWLICRENQCWSKKW